jgi:hypothetical protein
MKEIIGLWKPITSFQDACDAKEVKILLPHNDVIKLTHWRYDGINFQGYNGVNTNKYCLLMIRDLIIKRLIKKSVPLNKSKLNGVKG